MKKKIGIVMLVALGISAIGFSGGCSENHEATAKCKDSKDSETCSKCCTENKASGNTFSGSGCTCRGGG